MQFRVPISYDGGKTTNMTTLTSDNDPFEERERGGGCCDCTGCASGPSGWSSGDGFCGCNTNEVDCHCIIS